MADFISWRDEWLLNIGNFDTDHKELARLVNLLAEHSAKGPADSMIPLFEKLLNHIRKHFGQEEEFMAEIGFPGFNEHKTEHALQLASFTSMRRALETQSSLSQEDLLGIKMWFFDHVAGEDRHYADYYEKISE